MSGDGGFELRRATREDAAAMGRVAHHAFSHFNLSVGIPPQIDAGGHTDDDRAVDFFTQSIDSALSTPACYAIVATPAQQNSIIGGALLHYNGEGVHSIGPVFVDPQHSNHGVASAIMRALRDRALTVDAATSIRLLQVAHNTKSFCLYAKLGFNPVEIVSYFQGRLDESKHAAACAELGLPIDLDVTVRLMQEADVPACAALFEKVMGYPRELEIRTAMTVHPTYTWVASQGESVVAFTTGFHQSGFSVSTNEESFVALFRHASHNWDLISPGPDPTVHISTRLHPQLAHWAIRCGLRLISWTICG